jgi:hypothetical protein
MTEFALLCYCRGDRVTSLERPLIKIKGSGVVWGVKYSVLFIPSSEMVDFSGQVKVVRRSCVIYSFFLKIKQKPLREFQTFAALTTSCGT